MAISVLNQNIVGDAKAIAHGYEEFIFDELIPEIICQKHWSPIVFKDSYRKAVNFLYADWIALDFDSPETTLKDALNIWCDTAHIIGTTRNHQKIKHPGASNEAGPCDRFRVVLKLTERCLSGKDYSFTAKRLQNIYSADRQATDCARFFYPCTEIVSCTAFEEDMLTQEIFVAPKIIDCRVSVPAVGDKYHIPGSLRALRKGIRPVPSHRNNTLYMVSCDLAKQGMTFERIYELVQEFFPTSEDFTQKEIEATIRSAIAGKAVCFRDWN